jgi:hypothetical protein
VALSQRLGNQHLQALLRARLLQAKLTVSDPHDVYEQEADRVADQVMRTPDPTAVGGLTTTRVQRMCRDCDEELMRSASDAGSAPTVDATTEHAIRTLSSRGSPLPESVREFMEPRFNADFRSVRVHNDPQAHELALGLNAQAFTVGRDVVFGAGRYAPHTDSGKRLLAHELTHVVQQSAVTTSPSRLQRRTETDWGEAKAPRAESTAAVNSIAFVRSRTGERFVDIHDAPYARSTPFGQLEHGQRVHVLQEVNAQGRWLKVLVMGVTGYVRASQIHFPPARLIERDPGLRLIRVRQGLSFYALVHEQYGIRGNEGAKDRNMNHFINAIRSVNKPDAFNVKTGVWDDVGNFLLSGRDASDTYLKANFDLWIPSFGVAVRMDVGSGTVRGELTRVIRNIDQTISDFVEACRLSGAYIPHAVSSRAGEVGEGLLSGLLDFALDAVKILAGSTAAGALIGALFGGAGAIPGAEVGFEIGLIILKYYGLALLIEAILKIAGGMFGKLGEFISLTWQANGDKKQLDLAARALADAIGLLVSAILIAVFIYVTKKGFDAIAKTRFAAKVGASRLGQWVAERSRQTTTVAAPLAAANAPAVAPPTVPAAAPPAPAPVPPVTELRIGGFNRPPERVVNPNAMPARDPIPEREVSGFGRNPAWRTPPSDPPRLEVGGFARPAVRGAPHPQPTTVEGFRGDPLKDVPAGDYSVTFPSGPTIAEPIPTSLGPTRQPPPNVPTTVPLTSSPAAPAGAPAPAPPTPEVRVGGFARPPERVTPDPEVTPVEVKGFRRPQRDELLDEGIPPEGDFVMTVEVDPVTGQSKLSPPRMVSAGDAPKAPPKPPERTGKNDDFDTEAPTPVDNPKRTGRVNPGNDLPDKAGEIRAPDKTNDRPVEPEPKVIVDPELKPRPGDRNPAEPDDAVPKPVDTEITEPLPSIPPELQFNRERIGDYTIDGSRVLEGHVLRRRIVMMEHHGGKTTDIGPINRFIELLRADAASAGATRLEIMGLSIENASVRNVRRLVARIGGTVERIDARTIVIDVPVVGP